MSEQEKSLQEQEALQICPGDVLVIRSPHHLTPLQREKIQEMAQPIAESAQCSLLILDSGITAQVVPDMGRLMQNIENMTVAVAQMAQTNSQTLDAILQLAEGDREEEEDVEPTTYLNGKTLN